MCSFVFLLKRESLKGSNQRLIILILLVDQLKLICFSGSEEIL